MINNDKCDGMTTGESSREVDKINEREQIKDCGLLEGSLFLDTEVTKN